MAGVSAERVSGKRYLAMDRASVGKLEYIGGIVVAMAGASPRHNAVAVNVATQLRSQLGDGCHVFGSDQRVRVDETDAYLYPDISVACGELRFGGERPSSLINPSLIVEVLSRTTEDHDRGAKLAHYRQNPSVREILLIATRERKVESYRRLDTGQWLITDLVRGELELLGFVGVSIAIDGVYAGVDELPDDDPAI